MNLNKNRFTYFLLLTLLSIFICSGCEKETETPVQPSETITTAPTKSPAVSAAAEDKIQMNKDQTLVLNFIQPLTLCVNDARNQHEYQVMNLVFEGLVRAFADEKGNEIIKPAGAKSWSVSPDGTVWTFVIREHFWSDGIKVTAQQYVDSIQNLLTQKNAFLHADYAFDIKNAEQFRNGEVSFSLVGVKALSDNKLEITLDSVTPLEKKLIFPFFFPIRTDLIEAGGADFHKDFQSHAYNGPFLISEWDRTGGDMTLVKNPGYWDTENVYLETIHFSEKQSPGLVFSAVSPTTYFLAFNNNGGLSKLMGNAKIKMALSLSIDRDLITAAFVGDNVSSGFGLYPPGITSEDFRSRVNEPLIALYEQYGKDDVSLQELFKSGMEELNDNRSPDKVNLVFMIPASASTSEKETYALLREMWQEKLLINVELREVQLADFRYDRDHGRYDILPGSCGGAYGDPRAYAELFLSGTKFSALNGSFSSALYDETFEKLSGESDIKKRTEIYGDLEKILTAEEFGISPLYYSSPIPPAPANIKNACYLPFMGIYDFSRAYIY